MHTDAGNRTVAAKSTITTATEKVTPRGISLLNSTIGAYGRILEAG